MTTTTHLSGFYFSGNLPYVEYNTQVECEFTLSCNNITIATEKYLPIDDKITIDFKSIMTNIAITAPTSASSVAIPLYTYTIREVGSKFPSLPHAFSCLLGGVDDNLASEAFVEVNWLTWQPQTVRTLYNTPRYLSYVALNDATVYVKAYFSDNVPQTIELSTLEANQIHTIDVTFGTVRSQFDSQPIYFDVWAESASATTYVQRYMLTGLIINGDVYLWVNSLGGFDTAIFDGELSSELSALSSKAVVNGREVAFNSESIKTLTKHTGYFLNPNEKLWIQEFFTSIKQYYLDDGLLKEIVLDDSKPSTVRGELSSYEFSYRLSTQSKYLNLARLPEPELLTVINPAGEVFNLAPRLIEYAGADPSDGEVLIPCQYPNGTTWRTITLSRLREDLKNSINNVGHSSTADSATEADHATKADTADVAKSLRTPSYSDGAMGGGGAMYEDAATGESTLVVHNVIAKNGLTVPKLTVRVMTATGGINITSAAAAKITRVVDGGTYWKCYYKSDLQYWEVLDQPKAMDGLGGYFWGLVTSVSESAVDGEHWINVSKTTVAEGSSITPKADTELALCGNRSTDSDKAYRKSFIIESCGVDREDGHPYQATYVYIDSFSLGTWVNNYNPKCTWFNGKYLSMSPSYIGIYLPDGSIVRQPVDRGEWSASKVPYRDYERVNHNYAIWQCVVESTTAEPSRTSTDWVMVTDNSAQAAPLRLDIFTDGDGGLYPPDETCEVWARCMKGFEDLTSLVTSWSISRDSGNEQNDLAWGIDHIKFNGTITIGFRDLGVNAFRATRTKFTITAQVADENIIGILEI